MRVVVVGQLARDVVLVVDEMPSAGAAADVRERRETLGGKGANQAVALVQLGAEVSLLAVAGDDVIGDQLLAQAAQDGINVSLVVRREGTLSALIVEALERDGRWRYLQDLPAPVLLTRADVDAAASVLRAADAVLVQLQQPLPAVAAAARYGRDGGALVVFDGVPDESLLDVADVLRADEHEARMLGGDARKLLEAGPGLVALGTEDGNRFVWDDPRWGSGDLLVPIEDGPAVDTTGGGDSFVAALTVALLRGEDPPAAARRATEASGSTVRHPGGRPTLRPW
jgi:ribokinase